MPGYDTIRLWLPKEKVKNTELLSEIPCLLKHVKEIYCRETDISSITGNLKNFRVRVNDRGVSLAGSLCKYQLGNNIETLDRQMTKEAFNKLSDELHLPISESKVRRIDFAENLMLNYNVPFYYPFFGQARYYNRLEQDNGIYYRNSNRQMLFYDKIREQKINSIPIPENLQDLNLLRYEIRFMQRINNQFKLNEVKASTLYNEKFYIDIANRWKAEYLKINKHKLFNFKSNAINNKKHFDRLIMLYGIKSLGGEAAILQMIEQAKLQGIFKNKMQVKRFKDKVKLLCHTPALSFESDAIIELDKKITEAVR